MAPFGWGSESERSLVRTSEGFALNRVIIKVEVPGEAVMSQETLAIVHLLALGKFWVPSEIWFAAQSEIGLLL
ncbi:MAG: hypothetical protein AAGB46_02525 [Verrucomicrobiota bacterium]